MIRLVCALILAWLTAISSIASAQSAADAGRFVTFEKVETNLIAPPKIVVWLPPGYDNSKRRYGVVYMQDGQNLFDPARSNFNKIWAADRSALRLIAAKKTAPFIIVGIDHPGKDRQRQYMPQSLYTGMSAPIRTKLDGFMTGPVTSDAYLKFLVTELKPKIDATFRTRRDPRHTAIMGSSMGGLISLYAVTAYPKVFGIAGAVSTHLPLGNPLWSDTERAEIFTAWSNYVKNTLGRPKGRRVWFDHGDATLDYFYGPYQEVVDAALLETGWRKDQDFSSRLYKKAGHEENAWAARLDDIFSWMLKNWE
jgi:predicted alpha/beta superfamily hydrolase